MASGTELRLYRVAATPYPAYNPKSPLAQGLLKLPVLAASTSLRRSRKAGAARMDAGWAASTSLRRSRKAGAARMDAG
ncbi:hypothetical protein [Klebsiella pneumoniae]|nr:hypothetical protein [Klebsiella pneumoniae]